MALTAKPEDDRLLRFGETYGERLVKGLTAFVILIGCLDRALLTRLKRLPGPFHVGATAGRSDMIDHKGLAADVCDSESSRDGAVGNHYVAEIMDSLVQLHDSSENIALLRSLGISAHGTGQEAEEHRHHYGEYPVHIVIH